MIAARAYVSTEFRAAEDMLRGNRPAARAVSATWDATPVGWYDFLEGLVLKDKIKPVHKAYAERFFSVAQVKTLAQLPAPQTQLTPRGSLFLAWLHGNDYFEVEIYEDATVDWFARNRATLHTWGTDETRDALGHHGEEFWSALSRAAGTS